MEEIMDRIRGIDWKRETSSLFDKIKSIAKKIGRVAAKQLLCLYYVLTEGDLSITEKAWVYAALVYVLIPGDLLPRKVFSMLGIVDDAGALYYVIKKVKSKMTPHIAQLVEIKLDEWFGYEITTSM